MAQMIKTPPAMWETWAWSLGWEDPLQKGMATHSSILALRSQWTEEPGSLQFMGLKRVGHNWAIFTCTCHLIQTVFHEFDSFILNLSKFNIAAAKSLQLCLILCDHRDGSPPGSPVPGILQARTLEWVAISFSSAWKWKVKGKSLSRIWL